MAMMMREKKKEKNKKPKHQAVPHLTEDPLPIFVTNVSEEVSSHSSLEENIAIVVDKSSENIQRTEHEDTVKAVKEQKTVDKQLKPHTSTEDIQIKTELVERESSLNTIGNLKDNLRISYASLNAQLEQINISTETESSSITNVECDSCLEATNTTIEEVSRESCATDQTETTEDVCPSAPEIDEVPNVQELPQVSETPLVKTWENRPKLQCMPLEEAIRVYGGAEIHEVRAMSEREEAIVEAGPLSGPEHPLVDLLSTFRCSLNAVERERIELERGFAEEEKTRMRLWKVEKRTVSVSEKCPCGSDVDLRAAYEHAELMKGMMPVAKMKLESLLRDTQHSFCHHQHAALLAHCQIEELISETTQSNKGCIREALALILKELRVSDGYASAHCGALKRWAEALSAALLDRRDLRQLLFLVHQLARQTRSVRWAGRLIELSAADSVEVARVIAILDLIMSGTSSVDAADECTEEADEAWEEVDKKGCGTAVWDGALRERDLLALLRAIPSRDVIATLALFRCRDITKAVEYEWGDGSGGRGVLKAACGTRVLTAAVARAVQTHAHYDRLTRELLRLPVGAVCGLADLHLHCRSSYAPSLKAQITAELEETFAAAFRLLSDCGAPLDQLPFRMLEDHTAMVYCIGFMDMLHESSPRSLDGVDVVLPPSVSCASRVCLVARACVERDTDVNLAHAVLGFLMQVAVGRKSAPCAWFCESAARECMPTVLAAHPYLYTTAFHLLADAYQTGHLDQSSMRILAPAQWRPQSNEVRSVLDKFERTCPALIPPLLMEIDTTPYSGVSLQSQLDIGLWLTASVSGASHEYRWRVLRRLKLHRVWWGFPNVHHHVDDPPPFTPAADKDNNKLFLETYYLLATAWGHSVPVICTHGVEVLHRLASAGRTRDVIHCLSAILIIMTQSPESISLTPKFVEVFSLLAGSAPSLLQRALGRGAEPGANMLLKLMTAQLTHAPSVANVSVSSMLSVWLHALWGAGGSLLQAAMLACPLTAQLDQHCALTEESNPGSVTAALSPYNPALCAAALRTRHGHEARALWPRVLAALHAQRARGDSAHVDNALKSIGVQITSDELVIHKTAAAVLAAPLSSTAYLELWILFFSLYLQRPPNDPREITAPIGPLFFSGFIKSRVLAQLKKRLQEVITHHYTESERLKNEHKLLTVQPETTNTEQNQIVKSSKQDLDLLPPLKLIDLTGESNESSESSESEEERIEDIEVNVGEGDRQLQNLITYHVAAETISRTYLNWLEEGDKVRAMPHMLRHIPDQALAAARKAELSKLMPPSSPDDEDMVPAAGDPRPLVVPRTPFERVVALLNTYPVTGTRRRRRMSIKSPIQDVKVESPRHSVSLIDKHLRDLERLAQEWESEVSRVSKLDSSLWELVATLRVRRPIAPVLKSCPNKCKPLTLVVPAQEWCISTGAERGIRDNRTGARNALRRLARPRPNAAKTAAALQTITRQVTSADTAMLIMERAWLCGRDARVEPCAPAKLALTSIVTDLAEKFIIHDAKLTATLLGRWWGGSVTSVGSLQDALSSSLLCPRRLPLSAWATVYNTVLALNVHPHMAFSCLSKFEVCRWSEVISHEQRQSVLEALVDAAQRHGPTPPDEYAMLLELIGVHISLLCDARALSAVLVRCARACSARRLPPAAAAHVHTAAENHAHELTSNELGNTLRELGVVWWEARSKGLDYTAYVMHVAKLFRTLVFAFVDTASSEHYTADKVAWYSWSALQECWGAWVLPRADLPPLLPSGGEAENYALQHFTRDVAHLCHACKGSEPYILQEVFSWTSQLLPTSSAQWTQEQRIRISALLVEAAALPWHQHQWWTARCMNTVLKLCATDDTEGLLWTCGALRATTAAAWLQGVSDEHLAPHLAALFYVLTTAPFLTETLEAATELPWWRLPAVALEAALERFFTDKYSVTVPYHALPSFKLILYASELAVHPTNSSFLRHSSSEKRHSCVSLWVRAASAPTLPSHVAAATSHLLDVLTALAPAIQSMEGELEGLLNRAVTILCTEPAGANALPVWVTWLATAPPALVSAALSAAASLTVFQYYAALADAAIRALMQSTEPTSWSDIHPRLARSHWQSASNLLLKGGLHAAYATAIAHPPTEQEMRAIVSAFTQLTMNFEQSEVMLALWVCLLCRVDAAGAAPALLAAWGEAPRRSLLRAMSLTSAAREPTPRLRLLCRLAQCILTPNCDTLVKGYEDSCAQVLGSNPGDVQSWGRSPHPGKLPLLAMRILPKYTKYFEVEYELTPKES